MLMEDLKTDYRRSLEATMNAVDAMSLPTPHDLGHRTLRCGVQLHDLINLHRSLELDLELADNPDNPNATMRSRQFLLDVVSIHDVEMSGALEMSARLINEMNARERAEAQAIDLEYELSRQRKRLERTIAEKTQALTRQNSAIEWANKQLVSSNAKLQDFAHIASHDLREPIRAASSHASLLLEFYGEDLNADVTKRLGRICALMERMGQFTAGLLEYCRLDVESAVDLVDTTALISEIKEDLAEFVCARDAKIIVADDLPSAAGNKSQLRIIFQNLITNGIKYNTSAMRQIDVGWTSSATPAESGSICFSVKDNGIGIAPEHRDSVFRIFKRLEGDESQEEGAGVGLTFVKRVVESLGGEIWLDSELGAGTTFYFTNAGASHEDLL